MIVWRSAADRRYTLYWGTNLTDVLTPLATDLPGTPPENSYTDAVHGAAGTIFYRINVRK